MSQKKIIHIVPDEKFIDRASREFEIAAPGLHRFVIIDESHPLKFIRATSIEFVPKKNFRLLMEDPNIAGVIFHSLRPNSLLGTIPRDKTVIWIGWGFDYYPLLLATAYPDGFLLERTKKVFEEIDDSDRKQARWRWQNVYSGPVNYLSRIRKLLRLRRIDYFSPVLKPEYEMARSLNPLFTAQYLPWNYGTLEDDLTVRYDTDGPPGEDVLVGNSGDPQNNHIEALELLRDHLKLNDQKIIVPLSYGNRQYSKKIIELGTTWFGENFDPLTEFMSLDDYTERVKSCGFVFVNHLRQQAYANISTLMYAGARIYMNKKSPLYQWMKRCGAHIDSIDTVKWPLEPLSEAQRSDNRKFVKQHRGRTTLRERTRSMVKVALGE